MTREEAIEVYNGLINQKIKEAFEFFAPELAESEDERIRKGLIEALKASKTVGELKFVIPEPTREECIAYLEKQKENLKSADSIPADCVSDAKCEDRWHKVADFLPDSGRDVLAKDALGNCLLASFDGDQWFVSVYDGEDKPIVYTPSIKEWCDIPSEKQKEQKPISFSEPYNPDDYEVVMGENTTSIKQKEQKQEWGEEDEDMLNSCISSIEEAKENRYAYKETDGDTSYDREINWLKSLRPQQKQKWSEEDKK